MQEDMASDLKPAFSIHKLLCRPDGSDYEFEFMFAESKVPGEPWESTEEHLQSACAEVDNESKNVYGMIQIGLKVKFYKHENFVFTHLSPVMDLVTEVRDVTAWANYIKSHPLSLE